MPSKSEFKYHVSRCARIHYNSKLQRTNWEAVSQEMQIPVLQCLEMFDYKIAHIPVRRFKETEEWRIDDILALKEFTELNFTNMTMHDWELSGKYINIDHSNCIAKMWAFSQFTMTKPLFEQITEYRHAGLLWPTIWYRTKPGCAQDILRVSYMCTSKDKIVHRTKRPKAKFSISKHQHWTPEEDDCLVNLLSRYSRGSDVDWNEISLKIGHSKNACRYRRILLRSRLYFKGEEGSMDVDEQYSDTRTSTSSLSNSRGSPN